MLTASRKSLSLSNIDYENVRLQQPASSEDLIYDDPWNTEDALQTLLKRRSMFGSNNLLATDSYSGRTSPFATLDEDEENSTNFLEGWLDKYW